MSSKTSMRSILCFSIAAALLAVVPTRTASAAESVTLTVTAVGHKYTQPPPIKKEDVEVFQGKERMQVSDWKRGESLFIAIMIDDSLDQSVANQWNELRAFINA